MSCCAGGSNVIRLRMMRAFLRLTLGLLWLGSTSCDSKTRDYSAEALGSGAASTPTGAAHADAAAGAGASSSGTSAHGANTVSPLSSNGPGSSSGAAILDGGPSSGSGGPEGDAGVGSSSGAGTGTAGSSSGGPPDGDAGGSGNGPDGNGSGNTDASSSGNGDGDGGVEGESGSALAAATEFCDAYFEGICKRRVACGRDCTSGGGYRNYPIECHDALASLAQGYLTYNPDNAAECLAGYELRGCPSGGDPTACALVFSGTVAIAEECAATEFAHVFDECATGFCKRAQLQNPQRLECLGTCAAFSGLGKTCDENSTLNLRCAPDLVCVDNK